MSPDELLLLARISAAYRRQSPHVAANINMIASSVFQRCTLRKSGQERASSSGKRAASTQAGPGSVRRDDKRHGASWSLRYTTAVIDLAPSTRRHNAPAADGRHGRPVRSVAVHAVRDQVVSRGVGLGREDGWNAALSWANSVAATTSPRRAGRPTACSRSTAPTPSR